MILILAIASIFPYQVFGDPNPIVGGGFSQITSHSWLASIQKANYHICVGSIISDKVILTAAHCVFDSSPDSLIVRVGSSRTDSGGTWHSVVEKKMHENFDMIGLGDGFIHDVALIKVASIFGLGSSVTIIQLAHTGSKVSPGTVVSVAGWGSVTSFGPQIMELKSTDLQVIDDAACARAYGDQTGMRMSSNHLICAALLGRDSCNGDSGAPLVNGRVQIGIVSTGLGCADPRYPGIYVDVAYYREWIHTNSRILESSNIPLRKSTTPGPVHKNRLYAKPSILGTR